MSRTVAGLVGRADSRTGCLFTRIETKSMSNPCVSDGRVTDSSAAGNRGGIEQLIRDRFQPKAEWDLLTSSSGKKIQCTCLGRVGFFFHSFAQTDGDTCGSIEWVVHYATYSRGVPRYFPPHAVVCGFHTSVLLTVSSAWC